MDMAYRHRLQKETKKDFGETFKREKNRIKNRTTLIQIQTLHVVNNKSVKRNGLCTAKPKVIHITKHPKTRNQTRIQYKSPDRKPFLRNPSDINKGQKRELRNVQKYIIKHV